MTLCLSRHTLLCSMMGPVVHPLTRLVLSGRSGERIIRHTNSGPQAMGLRSGGGGAAGEQAARRADTAARDRGVLGGTPAPPALLPTTIFHRTLRRPPAPLSVTAESPQRPTSPAERQTRPCAASKNLTCAALRRPAPLGPVLRASCSGQQNSPQSLVVATIAA